VNERERERIFFSSSLSFVYAFLSFGCFMYANIQQHPHTTHIIFYVKKHVKKGISALHHHHDDDDNIKLCVVSE
jgi:hypothetical protein